MEQILKSRYRIGEKISETPFSLTYKGVFVGTDKPVIVKIYKRGTLNSSLISSMRARVREFSLLTHHSLAKIFDGDYGWQGFYYVREFIEGMSLQEYLSREGKISEERACAIVDQILSALEETHARGIIHGALKPTNIFIDQQGLLKLTDFVIEGEVKSSVPQKIQENLIDAKYASPEEIEGNPATARSDFYALGMIFYEMLTGKPIFGEEGIRGNLRKLQVPSLLSKSDLSLFPRYLAEIIYKSLQTDPMMRFSSAAEFRESIEKKGVVKKVKADEELIRIFESSITQYGGEEIDKESELLENVGQVRLRWSKEKHRNWILAVVLGIAVVMGILYAFLFGR